MVLIINYDAFLYLYKIILLETQILHVFSASCQSELHLDGSQKLYFVKFGGAVFYTERR